MMADIALRVEGLGKRYRLGRQDNAGDGMYRYKSLRDTLGGLTKRPLATLRNAVVRRPMDEDNSFWALKDIDFEVKRGEVVGIIGRNGAGKSTLLKVLSRITKPTTGRVDLFGNVGSLLEVGTGFHPELSGRENIYLNGAILGMSRQQVAARFDEIVDFSEIGAFLDTAVKQYSSGMYMRLAFAVSAHLEPDILVVDEVLAVGDDAFQKKCLGKMKSVAGDGRTVLFVSHNMGAVTALCSTCVWLSAGQVQTVGPSDAVVGAYLRGGASGGHEATFASGALRSCKVTVDRDGFTLAADYAVDTPIDLPVLGFVVRDSLGNAICGDNPRLSRARRPDRASTRGRVTATVRSPKLRDGDYSLSVWFGDSGSDLVHHPDVLRMSVVGHDGGGATDPNVVGRVVPDTDWQFDTDVVTHG